MRPGDAFHHGEAKPAGIGLLPRGEVRFKDVLQILRRDALAVVHHFEDDPVLQMRARRQSEVHGTESDVRGPDEPERDDAFAPHRLLGVLHQVG